MLHRRSSATAVALLVLLGGALTACGFDYPTDRVNTIAAGANNRDAKVDALGIRLLSDTAGEARLIGTLTNNTAEEAEFTGVTGEGVALDGEPIKVPAGGRVNLAAAETTPILLSGDFTAGDVVTLDFNFTTDVEETVTIDVPVVKNCFQYTQVPEPVTSEDEGEAAAGAAAGAEETQASSTEESSEHAEDDHAEDPNYICEHPTGDAGH